MCRDKDAEVEAKKRKQSKRQLAQKNQKQKRKNSKLLREFCSTTAIDKIEEMIEEGQF